MFDKSIINRIKSATVAVVLVENGGSKPIAIYGTGFLVNPNGYVMTADYVSDKRKESIELREAKGKKAERTIFILHQNEGRVDFDTAVVDDRVAIISSQPACF